MSPSPRQSRPADQPEPDIARVAAIAVSMGDPAGIGPDIALMSWLQRQQHALPPFVLYADPDVLAQRARALGLAVPLAAVASPAEAAAAFADALPVWPVRIGAAGTDGADAAVVAAIEAATAAVAAGEALALVTNPIVKRTLDRAELPYPGHTEFLAELALRHGAARRPKPVMMLVADELKVVPVTVHIPLAAVPRALTRALIVETVRITAAALTHDFGIASPAHRRCRPQPACRRRRPDRQRGDGRHRAGHRRPRWRRASRSPARTRPTRCSMPRRAAPTTRPSPCTTTRR